MYELTVSGQYSKTTFTLTDREAKLFKSGNLRVTDYDECFSRAEFDEITDVLEYKRIITHCINHKCANINAIGDEVELIKISEDQSYVIYYLQSKYINDDMTVKSLYKYIEEYDFYIRVEKVNSDISVALDNASTIHPEEIVLNTVPV